MNYNFFKILKKLYKIKPLNYNFILLKKYLRFYRLFILLLKYLNNLQWIFIESQWILNEFQRITKYSQRFLKIFSKKNEKIMYNFFIQNLTEITNVLSKHFNIDNLIHVFSIICENFGKIIWCLNLRKYLISSFPQEKILRHKSSL